MAPRGMPARLDAPNGRGGAGRRSAGAENAELRRRAERAEGELRKARTVIEVQGNVSALLGELLEPRAPRSAPSE